MSRVVEKLTEGRLFNCPAVVAVATQLYYDEEKDTLRRGAGGGPGSIRRLSDIVYQLDLTYDLHSLSVDQLLSLLPREFDKFRRPQEAA